MTQLADAGALVAVPELGVEDAGEEVPLLQPANATTNTSTAAQRTPTDCRIRFSFESAQTCLNTRNAVRKPRWVCRPSEAVQPDSDAGGTPSALTTDLDAEQPARRLSYSVQEVEGVGGVVDEVDARAAWFDGKAKQGP